MKTDRPIFFSDTGTWRRSVMKRVAVLFADGFEEVEAITPLDFLRRAGIEVIAAGVVSRDVSGATISVSIPI